MAVRRGLLWLVLFALVAAQTLGLVHRVVHADGGGEPLALFAQDLHQDLHQHDEPGEATNWVAGLFSAHDDFGCRVFDQLAQGGLIPDLPAVVLPGFAPAFILQWTLGEYLARWAALFDARGPPSVR